MKNAEVFLLEKIIWHDKQGFTTFGDLDAKHVKDISRAMTEFAQETVMEVIKRLNNGEELDLGNGYHIHRQKRKKSSKFP